MFYIMYDFSFGHAVLTKYSAYGYIEGEVKEDQEVVIIVRRGEMDHSRPEQDIKLFPMELGPDTSKLYIYNAAWSAEHTMTGPSGTTCVHCFYNVM